MAGTWALRYHDSKRLKRYKETKKTHRVQRRTRRGKQDISVDKQVLHYYQENHGWQRSHHEKQNYHCQQEAQRNDGGRRRGRQLEAVVTAGSTEAVSETENLSEHMQERVDNAIEESETLEHFGTLRLDALSQKEKQDRLNMNQRPKLSYETFDGSYSAFGTFMKNAEQLYSFFPDDPE